MIQRAVEVCLMSYAGDISATECWDTLSTNSQSQLVDCRTVPEWQFVGIPDLSSISKKLLLVEWQRYPDMQENEKFCDEVTRGLESTESDPSNPVFIICRSGVRSAYAAMALAAIGYQSVFNVSQGFEGDPDEHGHRAKIGGWKFDNLPWRQ